MSNNILPKGFALSIQKRSSDDASALSEKSTSTEQSSKRSRSEFPVLEGKPKAASSSSSLNSSVSPSGGSSSSSKSTVTESSPRKERSVISIDELMGDNPRLRNTVMFLILLRVVAPNMNSDMNPYTVKNFKKKTSQVQKTITRDCFCVWIRIVLVVRLFTLGKDEELV